MDIAFVTSEYPPVSPGGAGRSSELIVSELRNRGINVDVFALIGEERTRSETNGIYSLPRGDQYPNPLGVGENISCLFNLPNLAEYDVVHVYNVRHIPACVIRTRTPIVATMNNEMWVCIDSTQLLKEGIPKYGLRKTIQYTKTKGYTGWKRVARLGLEITLKPLAKRADHFTAQTQGMMRVLTRCGYDSERVSVIPNVADLDFESNNYVDSKKAIFVGRLEENKGVKKVIRAFKQMDSGIRDEWTLDIYGSGTLQEEVQELIADEEDIEIDYCSYDDLPEVYESADVLIHASKYTEPFSRTWLEAMASSTAIICSTNPSSKDVLGNVANFYDPFSRRELVDTINEVFSDEKLRREMAERGRNELHKYVPQNVIPQYIDLYSQVAE